MNLKSSYIYNLFLIKLGDQRFWSRCRKVTIGLLLFQLVLFLWIYIPELKERWDDIYPLLIKASIVVIILVWIFWGYYRWFDKFTVVHRVVGFISKAVIILYLLQWFFLFLFWIINPPITITQLENVVQGYGLKRDYVSYDEISPNMKLAVLASEDQLFTDHDGFDVKAIKLALKYNKRHQKKTHGASTISQQTAKNVFLWQGRTMIRKALEVYFTFMIETFWSKKKILERYLNVIETGPGIFGVQAAARADFNKDAKDLTRAEAAMIAACLPSPKRYTVKPMATHVRARYDDIMVQMNNLEGDPDIDELIGVHQ